MDKNRIKEVLGGFSHEERNEIYGYLVKYEKEKESDYYRQLLAICTKPFLSLEETHSYQLDQRVRCIKSLPDFIENFYESTERGKKNDNAFKKESMKRTADSFALMGMLHGKEFPEKKRIKAKRDNPNSDLVYLNYLFYTGLVLSMPEKLEPQIKIEAEYRVSIPELNHVYFVDFAVIQKEDNKLLCLIECDEEHHKDQEEEDKVREKEIRSQFPDCRFCRIPVDEIYVMRDSSVSAIKRAKQLWDQVEKDLRIELKSELKSESTEEGSFSKSIFRRLSFFNR